MDILQKLKSILCKGIRRGALKSTQTPAAFIRPRQMDLKSVLHMKEGLGETSYARNSSIQKKFTDAMKHVIIDAAIDAYLSETPRCFRMADLGCSSGTNTLSLVGDIVNAIDERCHEKTRLVPQFMVFLNDLPGNDFNSIFISFSDFGSRLKNVRRRDEFHSVFMAGVPGSFYGRLFPSNSLHFIHSSHSLHWLSQVLDLTVQLFTNC